MEESILKAYEQYNYPSAEKLHKILGKKYRISDIRDALKKQDVYQLYYNKPGKLGGHILALAPLQLMQIDITFLDKFGGSNKGYKYILLCVDVFSRYAWGMPLKTKTISEISHAFKYIPQPQCVMSDSGNEFLGKEFQSLLDTKGIAHQTAILGDHNALGIVDRMTLTLKNVLYKKFIANNNTKWFDTLNDVFDTYNNTPHAGIYDFTPDEAMHNENVIAVLTSINSDLIKKSVNKEGVVEGDNVRIRKPNWTFKRGYTPKWSEDTSKVEKVVGNTVYINGKRHKIVDVQVVRGEVVREKEELGEALNKAVKEHRVKRALAKEGVDVNNTREKRVREIKFDKSLVGRLIDRGDGETGRIEKYEDDGDFKWFVKYDKKAKLKSEWMDKGEVEKFLVR